MFLNFPHNTCEHVLSVKDDHTGLLEVTSACYHNTFVNFNLSQKVCILLQQFFLFRKILLCLLNEIFELLCVALRCLKKQLIFFSGLACVLGVKWLLRLEEGLYFRQRMHLIVSKSSLHGPTVCTGLSLCQERLLP